METILDRSEIGTLLDRHGITVRGVDLMQKGSKHLSYRINERLLLKLSRARFDGESLKSRRVESIPYAAKLWHTGAFECQSGLVYYMVTDYLPGRDLFADCANLSDEQLFALGGRIAGFLSKLHSIEGRCFDIGHYVPTIPQYEGSWLDGHQAYVEHLRIGIKSVALNDKNRELIEVSLSFVEENFGCLEFQKGPRLLHNDLHPKNIIVHDGDLSGVIDWECSQYGEADFDLSHLVHWCLLPPDANLDFKPFLSSLFLQSGFRDEVPGLSTRLTIYQIEHEIQQLIWSRGGGEDDRCFRLTEWRDGRVDDFLLGLE